MTDLVVITDSNLPADDGMEEILERAGFTVRRADAHTVRAPMNSTRTATCLTYEGFTVAPIARVANARRALAEAVGRAAGNRAAWAVDGASVPAGALPDLPGSWPVDDAVSSLTAIKTAEDLAAVATTIAVCDAGHAEARGDGAGGLRLPA